VGLKDTKARTKVVIVGGVAGGAASYSVFGVLVYDALVDLLRAWRILPARRDNV
jgi:hypothetical protein